MSEIRTPMSAGMLFSYTFLMVWVSGFLISAASSTSPVRSLLVLLLSLVIWSPASLLTWKIARDNIDRLARETAEALRGRKPPWGKSAGNRMTSYLIVPWVATLGLCYLLAAILHVSNIYMLFGWAVPLPAVLRYSTRAERKAAQMLKMSRLKGGSVKAEGRP